MDAKAQLTRIQANRAKRDRSVRIAGPITRLVGRVLDDGELMEARNLALELAPVIDGEFRRHCRIGLLNEGTVAVRVDRPGLVFPMRVRWANSLQDAFSKRRNGARPRRIVFEYGRAGAAVPVLAGEGMQDIAGERG